MGGAKIFVLQMKDLVRIGVIILLGLALLIMALIVFLPERRNEAEPTHVPSTRSTRYIPGTYVSTIILHDIPVEVRVTVSENEILAVYLSNLDDVQRIFYPLIEPRMHDLAEEILRYQSAYIQPSTDYPVTTALLHQAVMEALSLATNVEYVGR